MTPLFAFGAYLRNKVKIIGIGGGPTGPNLYPIDFTDIVNRTTASPLAKFISYFHSLTSKMMRTFYNARFGTGFFDRNFCSESYKVQIWPSRVTSYPYARSYDRKTAFKAADVVASRNTFDCSRQI